MAKHGLTVAKAKNKYRPHFMSEFGHSCFSGLLSSMEEQQARMREKGGYENMLQRMNRLFNPMKMPGQAGHDGMTTPSPPT